MIFCQTQDCILPDYLFSDIVQNGEPGIVVVFSLDGSKVFPLMFVFREEGGIAHNFPRTLESNKSDPEFVQKCSSCHCLTGRHTNTNTNTNTNTKFQGGVVAAYLVHVCTGVLVQLVTAAEDDQSDLTVAEDRQLVRFLHHAKLSLVEGDLEGRRVWKPSHPSPHLPVPLVGNPRYLYLLPPHPGHRRYLLGGPYSRLNT